MHLVSCGPLAARRAPLAVAVLAMALLAAPAHAYIDPGAGGLLIQALLGGLATAAFLISRYWHQLVRRIKGQPPEQPKGGSEPDPR
ncbi:MAG: hypothetical protein NDJ94_23970 [Vicinamibacteria bacterium]|nr:hypothetical protein [Vicinamibacteria bacterium]